ncbi:hypothetical protein GOEFS_054_00500 [Gordonia effusa NBRC 100432]|uniref:Lipid/polyisoprenoid-binding YceI-like domain-containing protein n=1 Tax=Gordonia effusa NBRC 100432 TaxID=1077974 RepID=H0R035_9ACTN|nr:YceI family protein [Gordonia effusa]GAB18436.1 hypothetical protein GOEFS_054_00500 [Gordonia effusa NBRC 100432]
MSTHLAARITTSGGDPLTDAIVTVMSAAGLQHSISRTDVDGAIAVSDLDSGTYTVVATSPGYQPTARVAIVNGNPVTLGQIALVRAGGAPAPEAGRWEIDAGHSTIEISVRHLGISTVRGRFGDFRGSIDVADNVTRSSVTAEIATGSIDTDNSMRDDILRSKAFFDVEGFPTAQFHAGDIHPATDEGWTLSGTLTLRGTTVPVELELSYLGQVDDPWGGRRVGFRATGSLHRNDFGISFDDKLLSGVAQIGGTARVNLDIQAVRVAD